MAERRGPPPDTDQQARLAQMWMDLLSNVQQPKLPTFTDTASINITFDGAGAPLVTGMSGIVLVPFPCRIIAAVMFCGLYGVGGTVPAQCTASIELGLSQVGFWQGGQQSLTGGVAPAIADVSEQAQDITDWITDLQPSDIITYSLVDFLGTATFVTLTLWVRKIDAINIGLDRVTDSGSSITSDGSAVTLR
jgi:hypothetical protein